MGPITKLDYNNDYNYACCKTLDNNYNYKYANTKTFDYNYNYTLISFFQSLKGADLQKTAENLQ